MKSTNKIFQSIFILSSFHQKFYILFHNTVVPRINPVLSKIYFEIQHSNFESNELLQGTFGKN